MPSKLKLFRSPLGCEFDTVLEYPTSTASHEVSFNVHCSDVHETMCDIKMDITPTVGAQSAFKGIGSENVSNFKQHYKAYIGVASTQNTFKASKVGLSKICR